MIFIEKMICKNEEDNQRKECVNKLTFKNFYEGMFCVKCLDNSNSLLEFHKKFINLLDEFNFFCSSEQTELSNCNLKPNKIKFLIPKYLHQVLNQMTTNNFSHNSSLMLDNLKAISGSEVQQLKEKNSLDKSLKEKINRVSEDLIYNKNSPPQKDANIHKQNALIDAGIENLDPLIYSNN